MKELQYICPSCKFNSPLILVNSTYQCDNCGSVYILDQSVPILLPDDFEIVYTESSEIKKLTRNDIIENISEDEGRDNLLVKSKLKYILSYLDKMMEINNILVMGCGDGTDLLAIDEIFQGRHIYGCDIKLKIRPSMEKFTIHHRLFAGNIVNLPFADSNFDLIISNHVLEHVPNYREVIREQARLISHNGVVINITPNKSRLVGYFKSHYHPTIQSILQVNLRELKLRLNRRFENKYGAHAGFSQEEIKTIHSDYFRNVKFAEKWYYRGFLNRYLLYLIITPIIGNYIRFSHVVISRK